MIRIRRLTPRGRPIDEWHRVTVGRIQAASRLRAQLYGEAYDRAWRVVLGRRKGPAPAGQPPGYRTKKLYNAPQAQFRQTGLTARGWRFVIQHRPSVDRQDVSVYLEEGTSKMEARPFREAVLREAEPAFRSIQSIRTV